MISGNMVGMYSTIGKTLVLVDEDGNELTGVITENVQVFDAKPGEDIRAGKTAATDEGIVVGSAIIPDYETCTGKKYIAPGSEFKVVFVNDIYDYTELQCIICPFNSSINNSVAAEKVVIDNSIYDSNSTVVVATVSKNADEQSINFNITNTSETPYIVRLFAYRELY